MPIPNPSAQWTEPPTSALTLQMLNFVKVGSQWALTPQTATNEADGYALFAGDDFDIQEGRKVTLLSDGTIAMYGPGFSVPGTRLWPILIGGVWYFTDAKPSPLQGYVLSNRIVSTDLVASAARMSDGRIILY